MAVKELNAINVSHLDRIPQVIRENRPAFYKFIKNICEYIDNTTKAVYDFLNLSVKVIGTSFSPELDINYLERLLNKTGVSAYLLRDAGSASSEQFKPFNENDTRMAYFTALQGFALSRNTDGSKHGLIEILNALYPGDESATITDGGTDGISTIGKMSYKAEINNSVTSINSAFLGKYLSPDITGVDSQMSFKTAGYFGTQQISESTDFVGKYAESIDESTSMSLNWMDIVQDGSYYREQANVVKVEGNTEQVTYNKTGVWILEIK